MLVCRWTLTPSVYHIYILPTRPRRLQHIGSNNCIFVHSKHRFEKSSTVESWLGTEWLFLFPFLKSNMRHTYTYIIGHYNPSVRIVDIVPHATYVVCINFIHKWRDLQFKVDSERNKVFARNLMRGYRRRNTFRILILCLTWGSKPGFSSNMPTHYLLDHGDFSKITHSKPRICKFEQNVYVYHIKDHLICPLFKKILVLKIS